jgi:uncharacterized protein (TIGR02421 family)
VTTRPGAISDRWVEAVCARLATGQQVRRTLPEWGRLHVDRQLPFVCVYRRPTGGSDRGIHHFITGEASYLSAPGRRTLQPGLSRLVRGIVETLSREFGAFLILEVWSEREELDPDELPPVPRFRIHVPRRSELMSTVSTFEKALSTIRTGRRRAVVEIASRSPGHAPGFAPLFGREGAADLAVHWIGVSVQPVWRRPATGEYFPLLRRAMSRGFARATKQALFEFTREKTTHRPPHSHSLGQRALVKAVWEVDRKLAEVNASFDFLLQATPVNPHAALREFERAGYRGSPVFYYRPLPMDPALMKRKLYAIPIERVEDPTLATLFRGKRREVDLQINLLLERGSPRALYSSLQLYGSVGDDLLSTAREILDRISPRSRDGAVGGTLDAEGFARQARAEVEYYRRRHPELRCSVEVREDLAGLMVSRGNLLVGKAMRVPNSRAEALLQHEIGTHVLTYFNGTQQPFRQLHCGLAGYEELQEGLAVLSEYLVGGLSRPRLRLLAARVVAARSRIDGAGFEDTFHLLVGTFGFDRKTAFTITMRIHRAGGLTKDAVYLRGLVRLLDYLKEGGELETLFVGKIASQHVPVVLELQRRGVLYTPALQPRYMSHPKTSGNLDRARNGVTPLDLAKGSAR